MKNIKRVVSVLLVLLILVSIKPSSVSAITKYGFTYDTSEYNVSWKTT